jgi:3'-phosphoadenosine 5'-phosphosulfate sulfotransferase (PAPS reductase)/FAD synthetase
MNAPTLRVLSLGAGVQSTTLALLAVEGVLLKPDAAIFSDTKWEPRAVYEHLERLTKVLAEASIPVHVVSHGNLREDALDPDVPGIKIPAFISSPNTKEARGGLLNRTCTSRYKLDPINREIRRLLGATTTDRPCRYCDATGRRILPQSKHGGGEQEGVCSVCRGRGSVQRVSGAPKGKTTKSNG